MDWLPNNCRGNSRFIVVRIGEQPGGTGGGGFSPHQDRKCLLGFKIGVEA